MTTSAKLQKSDVIIARLGSIEEYQRIPATMLGWGFLPEAERRGVAPREEWKRRVEEAHICGMKFQGRVEFNADWRGMIDFDSNFMESVCLDLDERPIYTWWTFKYKGHYPYYYCRIFLMQAGMLSNGSEIFCRATMSLHRLRIKYACSTKKDKQTGSGSIRPTTIRTSFGLSATMPCCSSLSRCHSREGGNPEILCNIVDIQTI